VKYKSLLAMLLLAAVAHGAKIDPNFPEGWQKMGGGGPDRMRGRCDVGVDKKLAKKGQKNMTVRCDEAVPGFGGLTQGFAADEFRGKRARFSARLMTHNLYDINGPTRSTYWAPCSRCPWNPAARATGTWSQSDRVRRC
jgi:hypothetical protein